MRRSKQRYYYDNNITLFLAHCVRTTLETKAQRDVLTFLLLGNARRNRVIIVHNTQGKGDRQISYQSSNYIVVIVIPIKMMNICILYYRLLN